MDMELVKNLKGAQRLTGSLVMVSRFISRLEEQGMLLYKIFKRSKWFKWTQETQEALDWLKSFLTMPLVLASSLNVETPPLPPRMPSVQPSWWSERKRAMPLKSRG